MAVAAAVGPHVRGVQPRARVRPRPSSATANHFFRFEHPDAATLTTKLDAAQDWFGAIDAIGHRSVLVPGSVDQVDYRSQDPNGPYGGPLLALRVGALSDRRRRGRGDGLGRRRRSAPTIGSTIDLDGVERTVVGMVENPSDLEDKFVLLPPSALGESDDGRR